MSPASISSNGFSTVDGLIRGHRPDDRGKHVLAYPRVDGDLSTYEYYDLARIDETVERVSVCLLQHNASQQVDVGVGPTTSVTVLIRSRLLAMKTLQPSSLRQVLSF